LLTFVGLENFSIYEACRSTSTLFTFSSVISAKKLLYFQR
jgi:hypothetical protein